MLRSPRFVVSEGDCYITEIMNNDSNSWDRSYRPSIHHPTINDERDPRGNSNQNNQGTSIGTFHDGGMNLHNSFQQGMMFPNTGGEMGGQWGSNNNNSNSNDTFHNANQSFDAQPHYHHQQYANSNVAAGRQNHNMNNQPPEFFRSHYAMRNPNQGEHIGHAFQGQQNQQQQMDYPSMGPSHVQQQMQHQMHQQVHQRNMMFSHPNQGQNQQQRQRQQHQQHQQYQQHGQYHPMNQNNFSNEHHNYNMPNSNMLNHHHGGDSSSHHITQITPDRDFGRRKHNLYGPNNPSHLFTFGQTNDMSRNMNMNMNTDKNTKMTTVNKKARHQDQIGRTISKGSTDSEEGEKQHVENPSIICRCKKSRCLKLYCDCFQSNVLCNTMCKCVRCLNTEAENKKGGRLKLAKRDYLIRKPGSFGKKEKKTEDSCSCKNNRCLKKYCYCFRNQISCSLKCNCVGCENLGIHKRKSVADDI